MATAESFLSALEWDSLGQEALLLLQRLIRIDTTNAPGRNAGEIVIAELVRDLLLEVGIDSQIWEPQPGRGNLIARIAGDGRGGPPILLSGHLDVVPADPSRWKVHPFSGAIQDGFVWGRGAIDMKNMVAMEIAFVLALGRAGLRPARDVILALVADEEAGCESGSLWLARHEPDRLRAEYAISEIGGFTMTTGGRRFYPIQVAEKGMAWLTIRAMGTPGHGSLPNADNPIPKLARAAERLGSTRLPHHLAPNVDAFLSLLAENQKAPNSWVLRALKTAGLAEWVLDHAFPEPTLAATFDAALHNTANPTMFHAGEKVNQVPGSATMRIDGRTLPGYGARELISEIQTVIGSGYEIEVNQELPPVLGSWNDPLAARISRVIRRHDPEGIPIPSMIPGFTDAKAWSSLGMKCWGFSPVKLPADVAFARMFHGDNERIPVGGFLWGLRVFVELLAELVLDPAQPGG